MTTTATGQLVPVASRRTVHAAWSGIAFPVVFVASVAASNAPADNASDAAWRANYSSTGRQVGHLATGALLILGGLCLAVFLTALWRRIRAVHSSISPLPLVAAGSAAACIGAGGAVMAYVSGGELLGNYRLPAADVLRLSNDLGFALVGVAGMLATALAVSVLSVQGRRAGLLGRKTYVFGIVTSIALLFGMVFVPLVALLVWAPTVAIQWLRGETAK